MSRTFPHLAERRRLAGYSGARWGDVPDRVSFVWLFHLDWSGREDIVMIASEPLTFEQKDWMEVKNNTMVVITPKVGRRGKGMNG